MVNQISDLPGERTFGTTFNYEEWNNKTSEITLVRVPWASDYRDIAVFPSNNELVDYLYDQPNMRITGFSQLKYNQPVKVSIPVNVAMEYNYLMVYNPAAPTGAGVPDHGRYLYYFINDIIGDSTNSTRLVLQLDVVQTFLRETVFGQTYVEQGHVGIADSGIEACSQGVLTQPDGMDLGTDYVINDKSEFYIANKSDGYKVVVVSTLDLETSPGTLANPNRDSATGSDFEGLPNGAAMYVFDSPTAFTDYVASMSTTPWQLEGVVSITAVPNNVFQSESTVPRVQLNGKSVMKPTSSNHLKVEVFKAYPNFKDKLSFAIDAKYRMLKKFTVYPYVFFEVTMYTGEPLVLKPELWKDPDASMVIKNHIAQPSPRIGVRPYSYNAEVHEPSRPGADPDGTDNGEVWNVALWLANFPQFSIVNNGYLTTMASQAHSIAAQYKDLGWAQSRALNANSLGYDQATAGMNLSNDLTQQSTTAMQNQTSLANTTAGLSAIQAGVGSIAGGAGRGGGPGALMGAGGALNAGVSAAINVRQNTESSAISQRLARSQNDAQVGNQGYVRDTNKNYADYATKGDYQNGIQILNAKVNDAKMTQPTTAGTSGGDAFMLAIDGWKVSLRVKTIPRGARNVIGDYWLRYGYPINRFVAIPQNFQCCETFTYWKMKEVYITSAKCPEPMKQAIRGIFEKGVTVWHDATKMGRFNVMLDNNPIPGYYINNP